MLTDDDKSSTDSKTSIDDIKCEPESSIQSVSGSDEITVKEELPDNSDNVEVKEIKLEIEDTVIASKDFDMVLKIDSENASKDPKCSNDDIPKESNQTDSNRASESDQNSNRDPDDCETEELKCKHDRNSDKFLCEKENVLPPDSEETIRKNGPDNISAKAPNDAIKVKTGNEYGGDKGKLSPAHVSKSESVSSEDSGKSEGMYS